MVLHLAVMRISVFALGWGILLKFRRSTKQLRIALN
ncbi:not available [Yersinia enterocolitica]|nr:not available [Yersinia enterocolitica]UXD31727.1 not available [Yersinia enterocolitica]